MPSTFQPAATPQELAEPYEYAIHFHLSRALHACLLPEEKLFSLRAALQAHQQLSLAMKERGGAFAAYFAQHWQHLEATKL